MVREYKNILKDDEFECLSEETRKDVVIRSEKYDKETEAKQEIAEQMKNNIHLYPK